MGTLGSISSHWYNGTLLGMQQKGLDELNTNCRGFCLIQAVHLVNLRVVSNDLQLLINSLQQQQLVMGVHLDVDRSNHGSLSNCNIEIHPSMQLEWLLIVGDWSLVWLLEVSFLQPLPLRPRSHYGRNDGDGDGTVTFYRSHYTFRNANVNVALT